MIIFLRFIWLMIILGIGFVAAFYLKIPWIILISIAIVGLSLISDREMINFIKYWGERDEVAIEFIKESKKLSGDYLSFAEQCLQNYISIKRNWSDKNVEPFLADSIKIVKPIIKELSIKAIKLSVSASEIEYNLKQKYQDKITDKIEDLNQVSSDEYEEIKKKLEYQKNIYASLEDLREKIRTRLFNCIVTLKNVNLDILRLKFAGVNSGKIETSILMNELKELNSSMEDIVNVLNTIK